jgi:Protein of unknown function (DUF3027)
VGANRPPIGHNEGVNDTTLDALDPDPVAAAAIDLARAAAVALGVDGGVGDYVGVHAEAPYVVTHTFAASVPGYTGWNWAVTVARTADSEQVTVDEVVLLPGGDALLAPVWVPWSERMRPGDLSPGDLVPPRPDDPRLVPAYAEFDAASPDESVNYDSWDEWQADQVADSVGYGRVHVLSIDGRLDAAQRWLEGDGGPNTEMARLAPAHCGTCGFYLRLSGSLKAAFGVCGNELALADGRVVSVEHGCGAHSESMAELSDVELPGPVGAAIYDDGDTGDDVDPIE